MAVAAFGSVRSCGVTTTALAVTATWRADRRALLIAADPAGGTLAAGSGWPHESSLVSLAAAARRGFDPDLAWAHTHQLPGDAPVLAGPAAADQARSVLGMLRDLPGRLGEFDADVLVDCGRLDPGSPSLEVWERADRQILVVRPHLADLHALAAWTETRPLDRGRARLVTIGGGAYPDSEIAEALGIEVLARLPWDPYAAGLLKSVPATARQVRVAPLVRAARSLAERLAAQLAENPQSASSTAAPAGSSSQPRRRVPRGVAGGGGGPLGERCGP